jgi:hypothetical protein
MTVEVVLGRRVHDGGPQRLAESAGDLVQHLLDPFLHLERRLVVDPDDLVREAFLPAGHELVHGRQLRKE